MTDVLPSSVDAATYRQAVARFATGVTVVTTRLDGADLGMTASSFTSVSLDPVLVLVSVRREAHWLDVVRRAGTYGVSVLANSQQDLCAAFAAKGRTSDDALLERFPHSRGAATGCALFDGALATFECRVHTLTEAGDHTLVVGEVLDLAIRSERGYPLVFFEGALHDPVTVAQDASPEARAASGAA